MLRRLSPFLFDSIIQYFPSDFIWRSFRLNSIFGIEYQCLIYDSTHLKNKSSKHRISNIAGFVQFVSLEAVSFTYIKRQQAGTEIKRQFLRRTMQMVLLTSLIVSGHTNLVRELFYSLTNSLFTSYTQLISTEKCL